MNFFNYLRWVTIVVAEPIILFFLRLLQFLLRFLFLKIIFYFLLVCLNFFWCLIVDYNVLLWSFIILFIVLFIKLDYFNREIVLNNDRLFLMIKPTKLLLEWYNSLNWSVIFNNNCLRFIFLFYFFFINFCALKWFSTPWSNKNFILLNYRLL